MEFLTNHYIEIIGVILIFSGIVFLLKASAKSGVREILFYLVTRAESTFGGGTGELKYASVVTWLYERLPSFCRLVLSEKEIDTLIETAVDRMQDYLKNNENATKIVLEKNNKG